MFLSRQRTFLSDSTCICQPKQNTPFHQPTTSSLDKLPKCLVSADYNIIFTRRNRTLIFYHVNFILQVDSEEEKIPEEKFVEELAKNLPQGTDKTPELLDSALKDLPDRYIQMKIVIYMNLFIISRANYISKIYKYTHAHKWIFQLCAFGRKLHSHKSGTKITYGLWLYKYILKLIILYNYFLLL